MIISVPMSRVLVIRKLEFRICFEFRDSNFGFNTLNSKLFPSRGKPKPGPLGQDTLLIVLQATDR